MYPIKIKAIIEAKIPSNGKALSCFLGQIRWHNRMLCYLADFTLLYLDAKQSLTGKMAQWMLLLQEFEFKIQHRLGTQHAVADYLIWIDNGNNTIAGHDDFPNAEILRITIAEVKDGKHSSDKWLMEMISFLSMGLPPPQLRTDKKKRVAVKSRNFYLLKGILYHKGNDNIWQRCVRQDKKHMVLREAQCGTAGGALCRPGCNGPEGMASKTVVAHNVVMAWLTQKRRVAQTEDSVKVRKESLGLWTEETKE